MAGGPPQSLSDAITGRGGSWNRDGTILFAASNVSPILRIASTGGSPVPVTMVPAGGERGPSLPVISSRRSSLPVQRDADPGRCRRRGPAGSTDCGEPVRLLPDFTNALYAARPGGRGLLVFRRDRTLTAQRFDPDALETEGEMFPVAEGVAFGFPPGPVRRVHGVRQRHARISNRWDHAPPRARVGGSSGKRLETATKPAEIQNPYSVSPDGKMLAMQDRAWFQVKR